MATIQELRALALQIRDADEDRENTALKVGQFLYDLLGYLDTKADLTPTGPWSKRLSFNQAPIVALQSVEAIPDSQGQNNKMWWSSDDGQLKWKANDEVYPLGNPAYILYYCGNKIYRWSGSTTGFVDMTHTVINDLITGGEGDALSAEMGKWLYTNLYTIFSQLGNYAFTNGKPQIDWGGGYPPVIPPCTVSKTIGTGLSSTGGDSDVAFGDPLEVSIAITDNLYIVDDDNVAVTMGGSPVQGAWNASTMKVTIAAVTGNVVINVPSLTYAQQSALVFHLDCMNRGGQSGHWIDRIGDVDFALTDVTEADTGMVFNGSTSKGVASGSLDVPYDNCTIEVIADLVAFPSVSLAEEPILSNTLAACAAFNARAYKGSVMLQYIACATNSTGISSPKNCSFAFNSIDIRVATTKNSVLFKGVVQSDPRHQGTSDVNDFIAGVSDVFAIGYKNSSGDERFLNGSIKAIRVYNTKLTAEQMQQNYQLDEKRFNLS